MVLHIESYQSRRNAARLEARHRAADIDVGLPSFPSPGFLPAIRFEAILISIWVGGITELAADP
jgi:hypothetical protein